MEVKYSESLALGLPNSTGTVILEELGSVDLTTVSGRIDSSNAGDFDEVFRWLAGNNRHKYVLELAEVDYMSSAGLRAIVAALRENKKHNGDLRIASPSERVAEVFELAGLTGVFQIFDDKTAAVGSYT